VKKVISILINIILKIFGFVIITGFVLFPTIYLFASAKLINFSYTGEYYTYHEAIHNHISQALQNLDINISMLLTASFTVVILLIIYTRLAILYKIDELSKKIDLVCQYNQSQTKNITSKEEINKEEEKQNNSAINE